MLQKIVAYMQIALGTLIGALAVNLFILPNHLPSGGMNGLILVLHYLWNLPIGAFYFIANLPALFLLQRVYGWNGLAKTVWGTATFSLFIEVTASASKYAPTQNVLLAAIYAGILMGLGLGLAMRAGGSTGGTSPIGMLVQHYTGFELSRFILLSDLAILCLSILTVSVEAVMYGLIMTYLLAKVFQLVQDGFSSSRCLLIISESPGAVASAIMADIKRGVTYLEGTGGYTGQARQVVMCVVSETEVLRMKRLIQSADPEAFVLILDSREVTGRGFTLDTDARRIPFWATPSGD